MSGLFRRRRRGAQDDASAEEVSGSYAGETAAAGDLTGGAATDPAPVGGRDAAGHDSAVTPAPADTDADAQTLDALVGQAPDTRRRGRVRRRLRHLRRVREILMRDLGGFVFELHRSAADSPSVVDFKLQRLARVDGEIRQLEALLDDRRPLTVREPGIGGACPRCGELFGSDARFCWACGTSVASGAGAVPQLLAAHAAAAQVGGAETATTEISPGEAAGSWLSGQGAVGSEALPGDAEPLRWNESPDTTADQHPPAEEERP